MKEIDMFMCEENRPTSPCFCLCKRTNSASDIPEMVAVRNHDNQLWYFGHITSVPMSKIEKDAKWSDPIVIEYKVEE